MEGNGGKSKIKSPLNSNFKILSDLVGPTFPPVPTGMTGKTGSTGATGNTGATGE
ncbi:exosporium leader peptide-containing protein, partial [Bacillus cereus]|nr:exosporium leader peptide-containing protein [Bacillus cereus]